MIFITLITLNNSKQISNIAREKYNSELKLFDIGQEVLPNININKSIIKKRYTFVFNNVLMHIYEV